MVTISVEKKPGDLLLKVSGHLDGSSAWRILRLAQRLARGGAYTIDLGGLERMHTFGASVLAQGLPRAQARLENVRAEHRRILIAEGALSEEESEEESELAI